MIRIACPTLSVSALLAFTAACGPAAGEDAAQQPVEVAPSTSPTLHTEGLDTAVQSYCAWSGGSYWCQDWYSKSWCTNATSTTAWDYTGCGWRGWNSAGTIFCGTDYPGYSDGWQWGQNHSHCQ